MPNPEIDLTLSIQSMECRLIIIYGGKGKSEKAEEMANGKSFLKPPGGHRNFTGYCGERTVIWHDCSLKDVPADFLERVCGPYFYTQVLTNSGLTLWRADQLISTKNLDPGPWLDAHPFLRPVLILVK